MHNGGGKAYLSVTLELEISRNNRQEDISDFLSDEIPNAPLDTISSTSSTLYVEQPQSSIP